MSINTFLSTFVCFYCLLGISKYCTNYMGVGDSPIQHTSAHIKCGLFACCCLCLNVPLCSLSLSAFSQFFASFCFFFLLLTCSHRMASNNNNKNTYRKSQLLALLLCIGSADIALGNEEAEQRFLDVIHDLYKAGALNIEQLSF